MNDTTTPDSVSVRFARHEYALGYIQGRNDTAAADLDAWAFARFYTAHCDREGGPINVHTAYRHWLAEGAELDAESTLR